jgi:alpha-ribazole phosphatase
MQLYLIRHPEPRGSSGLCYGRLDVAVAPEALATAASSIRKYIPRCVLEQAVVYTSPLSRCVALARELARPHEAITVDDLIEMDFGIWEGQWWDAVPRVELDVWAEDVWGCRPGGGESAQCVATRWQTWAEYVRRTHSGPVIAVTHAGFIRVALACTGQLGRAEFARFPIGFGSVRRVELSAAPAAWLDRSEAPA